MSTDYIGAVAVHGVDGRLSFTGVVSAVGTGDNLLTDAQVTDNFDVGELQNGSSDTIGAAANNRRSEATFTIIPYDSDGAVTERAKAQFPNKLATVTIEGFGTAPNALLPFTGKWAYVGGGSMQVSRGGFISMTLPCRRWGACPRPPASTAARCPAQRRGSQTAPRRQ